MRNAARMLAFEELRRSCSDLAYAADDTMLVVGLAWFASSEEPQRTLLGIRSEIDRSFVEGFMRQWARTGRLSWKQRRVARQMVAYALVRLELQNQARERTETVEALIEMMRGGG